MAPDGMDIAGTELNLILIVQESAKHDINARMTLDGVDEGWIH